MTASSTPSTSGRGGLPAWVLWFGGLALVGVILVVALVMSGGDDKPPVEDETAKVQIGATTTAPDGSTTTGAGESSTDPGKKTPTTEGSNTTGTLPQMTDTSDPAVGMTLPTLSGTDVRTGKDFSITADGKGKIIVVMAHWCPHCQREIPLITDHVAENPLPADVELYGVSTRVEPSGGNYPPSKWLDSVDWPALTIADSQDNDAAVALGTSGFPFFIVVDTENKVVGRTSGEISMETFDKMVELAQGK